METKKFSLLKDEMPNTTSEEVPPFKESRTQVAGLAKERGRAI